MTVQFEAMAELAEEYHCSG